MAEVSYFLRGGAIAERIMFGETGKPYTLVQTTCGRCGGAGGSDKWKHTGWTCYDCGGNGRGPIKSFPVYTAEKLAKLNAAAEKRTAKRVAARQAKVAQEASEAAARRDEFLSANSAFLARIQQHMADEWVAKVYDEIMAKAALNEALRDALVRVMDKREERARKIAASDFVGAFGERIKIIGTVERVAEYERARFGGIGRETVFIVTVRDQNGNAIISKSPTFCAKEGDAVHLKATVKEHSTFRDERQTVVQRVSVIEKKHDVKEAA